MKLYLICSDRDDVGHHMGYDGDTFDRMSRAPQKRTMEDSMNDDQMKRSKRATDFDCVNINMNQFMAQRRESAEEEYRQIQNDLTSRNWGPQTKRYFADNLNLEQSMNWNKSTREQNHQFY